MTDVLEPSDITREMLKEMRKLQMQAMMETLAATHPKEGWNLLIRTHPDRPLKVKEFNTREAGRAEQERVIKVDKPQWTALVRDKRR